MAATNVWKSHCTEWLPCMHARTTTDVTLCAGAVYWVATIHARTHNHRCYTMCRCCVLSGYHARTHAQPQMLHYVQVLCTEWLPYMHARTTTAVTLCAGAVYWVATIHARTHNHRCYTMCRCCRGVFGRDLNPHSQYLFSLQKWTLISISLNPVFKDLDCNVILTWQVATCILQCDTDMASSCLYIAMWYWHGK
jgi:hypothetical protein